GFSHAFACHHPSACRVLRTGASVGESWPEPRREAPRLSPKSCYSVRVFTGLVQAMGTLRRRASTRTGATFTLEHTFGELVLGESIAVNGVCLTVTAFDATTFQVEASEETLRVTSLANLQAGAKLNL